MFLRDLYPEEFSQRINQLFQWLGGGFSLLVIVLPATLFTQTTVLFQLITLVACLYALYALIIAGLHKRDGAFGVITGFLILFVTFVNDILNANEIIETGYFVPFGLFLFIFAQSFILSLRFANAFLSIEKLSLTFQKFVPSKFLTHIAKGGIENIELGNAESSSITILFSDIRSFTTFSENVTPQELLNFLNAYFKRMNQPIHDNNGIIDKFIGDAIMALFDDPGGDRTVEAADAVKAAIAMQVELRKYNQHRQNYGYQPIANGIGIHSGPVIIGTVGSTDRMDSTVLGDVVNVASRLEGLTKYYHVPVIISADTQQLLADDHPFLCRELDFVHVKGKEKPVGIYEIFDGDPEPIRDLKHQILAPYQEGMKHYYAQNWEEAINLFKKCQQGYPEDRLSLLYMKRCQDYQKNPPGTDWNGAMRLRRMP